MDFIQQLKTRLNEGNLPGRMTQYEMAHGVRKKWVNQLTIPENARQACTLALLYPKNEDINLVLMQRKAHEGDRHSGQISFPGGGVEATDKTLAFTALRETYEEIGVLPKAVEILGKMTELYIPVSNYLVHPFVGFSQTAPTFKLETSEVERVIEAPFSIFLNPENLKKTEIRLSNGIKLKDVPYFDVFGNVVWGATAMMLKELVTIAGQVRG